MDLQSSSKEKKNSKSILRKLSDLLKISRGTSIPQWLKDRKKGGDIGKANAASKIMKFVSDVKLTQNKLREIYEIEKEYEFSKIKAQQEFPHVKQVMSKVISEARMAKMEKMKGVLTKSQYLVYSQMFRKSLQHY